jgi:hypothetical protein
LIAQVQASLRLAAQADPRFILYTESDKEAFFRSGLDDFLSRAPAGPDVGVVLAARSDQSFATFPPFQRYTEATINELWARCGAPGGDYSYGPLMLRRELLRHVMTLDNSLGWGWRHFVVGTARRFGYRIVHVEGHYPCPPEQRVEDDGERLHRMRQLAQNIQGLVQSMASGPAPTAGRMASGESEL